MILLEIKAVSTGYIPLLFKFLAFCSKFALFPMSVMAVLAALVTRPLAATAPMPASFSTFDLKFGISYQ